MSRVYPDIDKIKISQLYSEANFANKSSIETNCGQIFSKSSAITRDVLEIMQYADIAPNKTHICGYEFKTRQLWVLAGLVLLFFTSFMGTILMWYSSMFDDALLSNLLLVNNTEAFETWRKPPFRPLIKIHIFNYTNVVEYERGIHKKLHVEDVGPYIYEDVLERINIKFNGNGTVSYQESHSYRFMPEISRGRRQSDRIVVPNMPLLGAAAMSRDSYYMTRVAISAVLKSINAKPFVTLAAHRFIWGYDDSLYALAKGMLAFKKELPFEKFGILASRNGTSKDLITINTGENDIDTLGTINKFNGVQTMGHWSTEDCNRIQGSDGSIFPPKTIRAKKPVSIYHKDICRRMPLIFEKETKVLNGTVPAYRYVVPDTVFDHPEIDPQNQCYCNMDSGECPPQGVFNATPCAFGAPAFVSFPHFYNGDPALHEAISGLNPSTEEHQTFADIHPTMGFPMGGKTRVQLNIQVKKFFGIFQLDMFDDDLILPVAWIEAAVDTNTLPEALKEVIHRATFTAPGIEMALKLGFLLMTLVTFTAISIVLKGKWNDRVRRIRRLQRNPSGQDELIE